MSPPENELEERLKKMREEELLDFLRATIEDIEKLTERLESYVSRAHER